MKSPAKLLVIAATTSCLLTLAPAFAMARDATAVATSASITATPISAVLLNSVQAVKITSKVIEENTDLLQAQITLPVIAGMIDTQYQEELNRSIEKQANDLLESIRSESAEDKEAAKKYDYPARPFELNISYELKSDGSAADGGILSFIVSTYTYTGGAHGMTVDNTYNIHNEQKASAYMLEEALGDGGIAAANRAVRYSIQQNADTYFADAMATFAGVSPDQSFYLDHGVVNLVYQKYDIAPFSAGIIHIPVDPTTTIGPSISLNRKELNTDPNGTRFVPLRQAAEALGYQVIWNKSTRSAELVRDSKSASVTDQKNDYIPEQGATVSLIAAPKIIKGKLYVPSEFFDTILKLKVTFNTDNGSVTIVG